LAARIVTRGHTSRQFVRFATVGVTSNLALYLLYLVLTASGVGVKLAMTMLYIIGVALSFVFNKQWSFSHEGAHAPAFARYIAAYVLCYSLNLAGLMLFVDHLRLPHEIVQGVLILTLAAMLFLLQKSWVFRSNS